MIDLTSLVFPALSQLSHFCRRVLQAAQAHGLDFFLLFFHLIIKWFFILISHIKSFRIFFKDSQASFTFRILRYKLEKRLRTIYLRDWVFSNIFRHRSHDALKLFQHIKVLWTNVLQAHSHPRCVLPGLLCVSETHLRSCDHSV